LSSASDKLFAPIFFSHAKVLVKATYSRDLKN
jgi:hypothetical protein